ncbi:MAG: sulfite exporter TauE/SafE family protein [Betaproteobacteria bacterium]|nr:sulfite exporter TauE/SafE family protein [Betaproteobacteria bacterium]
MIEYSLLSMMLVGWLGGVHCLGMCGGIVSALSLSAPGGRAGWGILLGYNAGRLVSYALAGALAGAVGSSALLLDHVLPVSRVLYALASFMLLLLGLYLAGWSRAVLGIERLGGGLWLRLQPYVRHLLPVRHPGQAVLAGLVWGWLPCGLVYSVLVSALASGSAVHGALVMLAFGTGTLPNLLAMGWFARYLQAWRQSVWLRRLAGMLVAGFGLIGLLHWMTSGLAGYHV